MCSLGRDLLQEYRLRSCKTVLGILASSTNNSLTSVQIVGQARSLLQERGG